MLGESDLPTKRLGSGVNFQAIAQVQERMTKVTGSCLHTPASCSISPKLSKKLVGSHWVKVAGAHVTVILTLLLCKFAEGRSYFPLSFWITVIFNHLLPLRTAGDRRGWQHPHSLYHASQGSGHVMTPARHSFASVPALVLGSPGVVSFVTSVWRNDRPSIGSRLGWIELAG